LLGLNRKDMAAQLMTHLAVYYALWGRFEQADRHIATSRKLRQTIGENMTIEVLCLCKEAEVKIAREDPTAAQSLLDQAVILAGPASRQPDTMAGQSITGLAKRLKSIRD